MELAPSTFGIALYGALLAQRAAEVARSRRSVAAARAEGRAPLASGASVWQEVALYGVHMLFFAAPLLEAALRGWPGALVPVPLGLALLAFAQLVRRASMRALGAAWRIPPYAFTGDLLVTTGPYALVRHPNHAIVLLEFLVAPLLVGAPLAWLGLNLVHTPLLLARVRAEERSLRLGPYAAVMGDRPMFVPRLVGAAGRSAARP